MNRSTKFIAIGLSALALSACSTGKKANLAQNGAAGAGATTYAGKPSTSFSYNASGRRVNALKAPANQSYYFTFAGATMRPKDINALNVQANYLISHPRAVIRLAGNTDDRGSREYNVGLGWRRDQGVARFLQQQGVKPSQIKMVSYGKEKPVALGDTPRSWALNRRVDLVYTGY